MNREPRVRDVRQPQGQRPAATEPCRGHGEESGRPLPAADDVQIALAGRGNMNTPGKEGGSVRGSGRRQAWRVAVLAALLGSGLACGRRHTTSAVEPTFGTIEVESTPAGATILLDGGDTGSITPDDVTVTAGHHTVAVTIPGRTFLPPSRSVSVAADGVATCTFAELASLLTPSAVAHDFGAQGIGTTSAQWCFDVGNTGTAPDTGAFVLAGAQAGEFTLAAGGGPHIIAPGASRQVCVTFHPAGSGTRSAAIAVGEGAVTLTGTGFKVPCSLAADASVHDFGPQDAGTTYAAWCFTLTNHDAAACHDTLVLAGADAGDFALVSGAIFDLAPGASQPVCVAFRPTRAGAEHASIAIGAGSLALAGTGVGSCALSAPATPDGADFGAVCTDTLATRRLVITNSGNLACALGAAGCADFVVSPANTVVPPGGAATLTVTYAPGSVGTPSPCDVVLTAGAEHWTTRFTGSAIARPLADFSPAGGIIAHAGDPVQFTPQVQPNGSTVTSYAWDFGDGGTSGAASPTHRYSAGGSYTITLVATNACGSSPISSHTICIDELAYVVIYNFNSTTVPDYTTNVPGWGTSTPLVLYRGPNSGAGQLNNPVCGGVWTGEYLNAGHNQAASEALGTPGQSFANATLPVDHAECSASMTVTFGAAETQTNGPNAYINVGTCGHVTLGKVAGSKFCVPYSASTHCAAGDSRIEWGLESQPNVGQVKVDQMRLEFGCWYVCPQGAPQRAPLRVVNAGTSGAAR